MPTVTDEYGRTREVSMEEIRRALANADPGSIMIQEVTTDIYTGKQTVRNIPVSRDGSFDLYGNRMRFNTPSHSSYTPSYSGYTPPESKEERERRLKKEAEEREKRNQEIQEREAQIRKKVEEYRRTAESRYCCRSKLKTFRELEKQLPEKQAKLDREETVLSAERKTLEQFQIGYSDQDELLRATDISEHHRKLLLEKLQLRKQLETLGLFSFGAKKQIRNRIREIDTEITDRIGKIDFRKQQILEKRKENISRVEWAKNDFLRAADDALKYIGWRERCIPASTATLKIWRNYERKLLPIMEYLERHSPCTINDIYEHHPYKDDISTNAIVSYFRLDSIKPFYRREMSGGRAYFYFVFPEDYQSQNPEDWELEARKIRKGMADFSLISPEEWTMEGPKHEKWEDEAVKVSRDRAQKQAQEDRKNYENTLQQNLLPRQKKHKAGKIFAVILACLLVALLVAGGVVVSKIQERAITLVSKEISGTAWKGRSGAVKIHPDGHTLTIRDVGFSAGNPPREYTYILEARGLDDVYMILENQDPAAVKPREEIRVAFRFENEFEIYMYFLEYKGQILRDDKYSD